ncbi:MAG: phosphatidylserine decarboxylase [Verrucomicrobiaceae bacterium]
MPEPVIFFNRRTQTLETEVIYGENFLRWVYENPLGRAALWLLVKRAVFSRWYGWRMNRPASRAMIAPFITRYGIDTNEMADAPESFPHFNAFFSRKLKPAARPMEMDSETIIFPADGRHFAIPDIAANDGIFVKGIHFDLAALLGDVALSERFAGGALLISRLCPVDYHRFHFPCAGTPGEPRLLNGPLYSVNPVALRQRPGIFWENKRYVTELQTSNCGKVLLMEIGATCVGRVVHTCRASQPESKGAEKGFFLFGGSSVITIFEPHRVKFADDLLEHSAQGREVYARMGEAAARLC